MSGQFGSTRFWLASGGALCGAAVLGLSLGAYVTSTPASRWEDSASARDALSGMGDADDRTAAALRGPGEIRCKGCGPTLAERDRARDMAGLDLDGLIDGSRDPQVRDYMAQEDALPPIPPQAQRLPPMVERFAAAGEPAPPPPLRPTVAVQPVASSAAPVTVPAAAVVQPVAVTTTLP